jgi:hypothetical protein
VTAKKRRTTVGHNLEPAERLAIRLQIVQALSHKTTLIGQSGRGNNCATLSV